MESTKKDKLPPLSSREYKVMLDHRMFAIGKAAIKEFGAELVALARTVPKVAAQGKFRVDERREIVFLDTVDHLIAANRLVLRRRMERSKKPDDMPKVEYTLKCRSPDRHFAVGADVRTRGKLKAKLKLEEDIGPPFVSRFSLSNTVEGKRRRPRTLREAVRYFPALKKLKRDGARCDLELKLRPVNGLRAYERVYAGINLTLSQTKAEIAVILWSDGKWGRPLVAEFSFRYAVDETSNSRSTALAAMNFFERLQQFDWCLPEGRTKTRYVYREA